MVSFLLSLPQPDSGRLQRGDQALGVMLRAKRRIRFGVLFEHRGVGPLLGNLRRTPRDVETRRGLPAVLARERDSLRLQLLDAAGARVRIHVGMNPVPLTFRNACRGQRFADLRDAHVLALRILLHEELGGLLRHAGHLAERSDGLDVGLGTHALQRFARDRRDPSGGRLLPAFLFGLCFFFFVLLLVVVLFGRIVLAVALLGFGFLLALFGLLFLGFHLAFFLCGEGLHYIGHKPSFR